MNIETWQAAIKERGDDAYKLFAWKKFSDGGLEDFIDNNDLEKFMQETLGECSVLKPLDKLIELDIERYGNNAFLMWKVKTFSCSIFVDAVSNHTLTTHKFLERKLYANAPFNIDWAKAGVPIEIQIIHSKEWVIKTKGLSGYYIDSMRHPFPPIKELGL